MSEHPQTFTLVTDLCYFAQACPTRLIWKVTPMCVTFAGGRLTLNWAPFQTDTLRLKGLKKVDPGGGKLPLCIMSTLLLILPGQLQMIFKHFCLCGILNAAPASWMSGGGGVQGQMKVVSATRCVWSPPTSVAKRGEGLRAQGHVLSNLVLSRWDCAAPPNVFQDLVY